MTFIDECAITKLSSTTVAFNANGNTLLYTVPTGKRCVLVMAKVIAGANANSTDLTIGGNSTSYNDFVPTTQCDNLDAQYDVITLMPVNSTTPPKEKSYAAGTAIYMTVANQAGSATNTVDLFGYLY